MKKPSKHSALTDEQFKTAISVLCKTDPDLKLVLNEFGLPPFWIHPPGFPGIVSAILAQRVSIESARATFTKLEKSIGQITPEGFLSLSQDTVKKMGFSRQKASYIEGIARKVISGAFDFSILNSMHYDVARKTLIKFNGVGFWTADVYLLFSLRKPDIWPSGDLALEKATQELKGLSKRLNSEDVNIIADNWKPWRAVAARILWHYYLCKRGRGRTA